MDGEISEARKPGETEPHRETPRPIRPSRKLPQRPPSQAGISANSPPPLARTSNDFRTCRIVFFARPRKPRFRKPAQTQKRPGFPGRLRLRVRYSFGRPYGPVSSCAM